jgi:hypothetical protein
VVVPAGSLHGLAVNTVLKLSAEPDGPEWAKATVKATEAIRSTADIGKPVAGVRPATLWASVLVPSVSFQLTVAEPPADELADPAMRKFIESVKVAAKREGAIEWVPAQSSAQPQLRLRVYDGRAWILPGDGEWVRKDLQEKDSKLKIYKETPSVAIQAESAESAAIDLARKLHSRARAINLVRVAQSWNEALQGQGGGKNILVTAERSSVVAVKRNPYRDCTKENSPQDYERVATLDEKIVSPAYHCDIIKVTIQNTGQRDLDVNVSYVDAGGSIQHLYNKKSDDCTFTLTAGEGKAVRSAMVSTWQGGKGGSPDTVGREHIVVTAIEQKDKIQSDLCFDQGATRGVGEGQRGPTSGTAGSLLKTLRAAAVAPSATRGGGAMIEKDSNDAPESSAAVFSFEVTPSRMP